MIITNDKGSDFFVRVVFKGDAYGLDRKLVHGRGEPMIEFYDFEFAGKRGFDTCGQFVTRYNVRQLASIALGNGLCLSGGVPEWSIDGEALRPVIKTAIRLANMVDYVLANMVDCVLAK